MTQPAMDWDAAYRHDVPPPWSIGQPQPELAVLIDQGKVRGDVLDAGCGHAALSLALAARGYTVVGLDSSPTAIEAACREAAKRGLTNATFDVADIASFTGYDSRFATIFDSGCLHSLPPDKRQGYLQSIFRAAAPGAALYILAFAAGAFGDQDTGDRPGPHGFTETELREAVSTLWQVDEIRPAKIYANDSERNFPRDQFLDAQRDNQGHVLLPGFLLSAHKPERS
ncbi:MAG TPA: class I SAM-dependent methyltransferase [Mycobacterium sp.]|uniref:class I SAM-dependent methyltransferase n=1 Tax=Mycobacterium sp. TaxID=1785 RepID=UPI002D72D4CF|nr:class I SAM-dependent methyltransferase [Mycobacterium sp.]HZU46682.1 class I SAM-dependent methyltransferase [Mycobacterium sp.]